jgi:hypothetical protein
MDVGVFYLEVNPSELEAGQSPQSSAEVKDLWTYTSTLPYVLVERWLIKRRENILIAIQRCSLGSHCHEHWCHVQSCGCVETTPFKSAIL